MTVRGVWNDEEARLISESLGSFGLSAWLTGIERGRVSHRLATELAAGEEAANRERLYCHGCLESLSGSLCGCEMADVRELSLRGRRDD